MRVGMKNRKDVEVRRYTWQLNYNLLTHTLRSKQQSIKHLRRIV